MKILITSFLLLISFGNQLALCGTEPANPIRIHPNDTEIAKRYISMFDRDITEALQSFDPQNGLLKAIIPPDGVLSDSAVERLSIAEKKKIAENPEYIWSYSQSRGTAQLAGALAYAYSIKQSRYYKSPVILSYIKQIFSAFTKHQAESGDFVFSPIHYGTVFGTHEMAWRLEPLICAFEVIRSELSASEQDAFSLVLYRGMQFLLTHENSSLSNRGVVWCGVMALCYRFTGDKKYLDAADRVFSWVGRLFNADGEIREGPGPDLIYSTVSLQYLFLYRLMSGNKSLDPILIKSLNWYTRLFTSQLVPFEGMTTRMWISNGSVASGILAPLTFYADRDTSFAQIATFYLNALEKMPGGFTLSHSGGYFLRGAQYHYSPQNLKKIPYKPYAQLYKSDHSRYFLYGNNYQTAVTLCARKPMKGMQTWSYKGQPPLICPTRRVQSFALGIGFDSHLMDVPWDVSPTPYRLSTIANDIDVLIYATGTLSAAYVFTKDMTIVVYHPKSGKMTIEWVNQVSVGAELERVEGQIILFRNSDAGIHFNGRAPSIIQDEDIVRFRFESDEAYPWFAFTGPGSDAKVQQIRKGLILITITHPEKSIKVALNMSAEPVDVKINSSNIQKEKSLLPYEAVLLSQ